MFFTENGLMLGRSTQSLLDCMKKFILHLPFGTILASVLVKTKNKTKVAIKNQSKNWAEKAVKLRR